MTAQPILPDTDVLIDFLRGYPQAVTLVTSCADRIVLASIVIAELWAGAKGTAEEQALDEFTGLFPMLFG